MTGDLIRRGRDSKDVQAQKKKRPERRCPSVSQRRQALGETNSAGILILDFQPPKLKKTILCKPPSL